MKKFASFYMLVQAIGLIHAQVETVMTLNHPDKNGYQTSVAGTDKHKYGYELKENKHFHHTTSEKDGVRLGCYGYELEGKKYLTQYVADSHGYRIVSNQDLITVYPKSGSKRKASFRRGFEEDSSVSGNIRYFFPEGCRGVDVLIDNSSRLRAIAMPPPEVIPKLPVTMKTTPADAYIYSTPPNTYIPPGPPHIYAPNQIPVQTAKPPVIYLPPTAKPPVAYLPPTAKPSVAYLPPVTTTTKKPSNLYLPPNTYLPPVDASSVNKPSFTSPRPTISHEILPPAIPQSCSTSCCEETHCGKFVIPIPLKHHDTSSSCPQVAKLILPVNGFDADSIQKLSKSIQEEIDVTQLIKKILSNML